MSNENPFVGRTKNKDKTIFAIAGKTISRELGVLQMHLIDAFVEFYKIWVRYIKNMKI